MDCLLCGGEEETLRHFVMECLELQEIRRRYGVYGTEALEDILMFMEKNEDKVKKMPNRDVESEEEENQAVVVK